MAIRLMTVNLLNGRADAGHLVGILDRLEPDLVVTQELGPDAAGVIAARYPHHHLRPDLDHRGRGIAGRFEAVFGEIPLPWRSGLWGRFEVGSRRLLVANVHIRNPIVFPPWSSARIRGRQVDALFKWAEMIKDHDACIIAGDMNSSPSWPVYRRLASRWGDLVAEWARDSGEETAPTWAWRPGWPRMLRIDHVFGVGARVTKTRVEPVKGTDHAAVVVDLELE